MVMHEEEMAARWGLISWRLRAFCIRFWARCMSICWNWNQEWENSTEMAGAYYTTARTLYMYEIRH